MSSHRYINVSRNNDVTIVDVVDPTIQDQLLINELSNELLGFIDRESPQKLLIKFDRVTYCSSEVLGGLIRARKRAVSAGGQVRICGLQPSIRRLFEVSKLEKVFDIDESESEAISAFSAT